MPKAVFGISTANQVRNFTNITKGQKNTYIWYYSNWLIRNNTGGKFDRVVPADGTALHSVLSYQATFYKSKVDHLLVPKFFHEEANENFVWKLKFVRRIDWQPQIFSGNKNIERTLYLYKSESSTNVHIFYHVNLEWPFPDKYLEKMGLSIRGFEFIFPNQENSLKKFIESSSTIINSESGQEESITVPTWDIFFSRT